MPGRSDCLGATRHLAEPVMHHRPQHTYGVLGVKLLIMLGALDMPDTGSEIQHALQAKLVCTWVAAIIGPPSDTGLGLSSIFTTRTLAMQLQQQVRCFEEPGDVNHVLKNDAKGVLMKYELRTPSRPRVHPAGTTAWCYHSILINCCLNPDGLLHSPLTSAAAICA
eukprot:GHUV01028019.1.p1 GENE.GHUV01028019.1~~GHUV01028019.1.p1  ORF type:complete len:166 (-),score=20.02 GHUV01028019.1:533-1030(-)